MTNKTLPSMFKSKRLQMIFKGQAVPCGSKCFQSQDGAQFLGKLTDSDITELSVFIDAVGYKSKAGALVAPLIEYLGLEVQYENH